MPFSTGLTLYGNIDEKVLFISMLPNSYTGNSSISDISVCIFSRSLARARVVLLAFLVFAPFD